MSNTAEIALAPLPGRPQGPVEELANTLTHALGAIAALVALPFLVESALHAGKAAWPRLVFGLSLVLLLAASATYHGVSAPDIKRRLRVLDHSSIYILIAGTYSAYSIEAVRSTAGILLFIAEWLIAALGLWLSARHMDKLKIAGPILYLVMGWLIAPFLARVQGNLGQQSFMLLAAGGVAYTVGVVFYALKKVPYFHVVWHLFVLAGAACHVASLLTAS